MGLVDPEEIVSLKVTSSHSKTLRITGAAHSLSSSIDSVVDNQSGYWYQWVYTAFLPRSAPRTSRQLSINLASFLGMARVDLMLQSQFSP